jgi:hypothetical protein
MLDDYLRHNELISFQILSYLTFPECCKVLFLNKTISSLLSTDTHDDQSTAVISPRLTHSSSHYIWMILLTKRLSIPSDLQYFSFEVGGWKQTFLEISSYESQLKRMPSPGCEFQKYLRAFLDLEADSPCVHAVMSGVAHLPLLLEHCFFNLESCEFTSEMDIAWSIMSSQSIVFHLTDSTSAPIILNYDLDFIQRYVRLFGWVVKSQNHLRVIMAQFNQLLCRSFRSKKSHPRCIEALRDLIRMRNGEFDLIRLWA